MTQDDRELAIIEGVRRGLADVEAGRVVSHEDAMTEIHAAIDAAQECRKRVRPPFPPIFRKVL